jgi:hypothetical protein
MVEEKKETKKEAEYALVEVPTQYGVAIGTPDGNAITTEQALVEILNLLKEIKKAVA